MSLRDFFGPSKKEIWTRIAAEIGGEHIKEGYFGKEAIIYRSGEWEIVLDTFTQSRGRGNSVTFTRLRAPFVNKDGFYFNCYRKNLFSAAAKVLGMQDIVVGETYFDHNYIIKSNNEEKVKTLLAGQQIKDMIMSIPKTGFKIRDNEGFFADPYPAGVDVLYFASQGLIKDRHTLKCLFDLFSLTLERLVQMDSAYADNPEVKLIKK